MQEKSDAQLLRDFAGGSDEAAFREIVARHTDLVYSAARRQVESDDLAADIAQNVFVDLARKAQPVGERLTADSSLAGWLHRSTRYLALNHLRDTRRRLTNERQAMEQLLTDSESSVNWEQIRPALDEALDSLADEDREALLLRYFKNQDYRAVGLALGVSDDTAQKRVSRAVERLREFFAKRGVTVGAGGLVVVISANVVQAAPVGLAVTISAAALAGTAATTATVIAATKTIAMTTLQKTVITAAFVAAASAGIFEARQAAQVREQNQTLQQQQAPLAEQIQQLQHERDEATNRLAGLLAENSWLKSNPKQTELLKLRGEVTQLRPLRKEVSTLQKLANQSVSGLPDWKPDQMKNVGRATPLDALQTYLWSGQATNLSEIGNSLIADENDPPTQDAFSGFVNDRSNHPFPNDGVTDIKILSQTFNSAAEVQLEVNARFGGGSGVTAPFTLRNVNGAWKLVVFNIRDKAGKISQLGFVNDSAAR